MSKTSNAKRICVVGAGPAGLTSIKACLEEDFHVVCYEKTDNISGLWRYREPLVEGVGTVYKSLTTNTSKEMSAFSDFPFPKEWPNYLEHKKMCEYFESYAKHFRLRPHIRCDHSVLNVCKSDDYDSTHTLVVRIHDIKHNTTFTEEYDGVMVCTGIAGMPYKPQFEGQELFKGQIIHSREIDTHLNEGQYEGKCAVVVGTGNSGCDCAVMLSNVCDKTYLSHRKSFQIISKLAKNGVPKGYYTSIMSFKGILSNILPVRLLDWYYKSKQNILFDSRSYGFPANNRGKPALNDVLPSKLLSGNVILKTTIDRFTENGLIFIGDKYETKCDLVVMATGYEKWYPFLDKALFDYTNDGQSSRGLYKRIFPAHLSQPCLALIGYPPNVLFFLHEMQARLYAQVMAGKCRLPSHRHMVADIEMQHKRPYMSDVAHIIGVAPDLKRLMFTDLALFLRLWFEGFCTYRFRLQGPHSWPGAREALMQSDYRIRYAVNPSAPNDVMNNESIANNIRIEKITLLKDTLEKYKHACVKDRINKVVLTCKWGIIMKTDVEIKASDVTYTEDWYLIRLGSDTIRAPELHEPFKLYDNWDSWQRHNWCEDQTGGTDNFLEIYGLVKYCKKLKELYEGHIDEIIKKLGEIKLG